MGRKNGTGQRAANPSQYQKQLREALSGWKEDLPRSAGVVIAAFDAATTGRLAVTYYNELLSSDFLDRLHDWEATCCWENGQYGIQSPSLFQIVSLAFGAPRNGKAELDDRILKQQMQRLVACRVDRTPFPLDMERPLVEKASHLLLYEGENRQKLLFTACAAIRKYHCDHAKEERNMALDKNCSDRAICLAACWPSWRRWRTAPTPMKTGGRPTPCECRRRLPCGPWRPGGSWRKSWSPIISSSAPACAITSESNPRRSWTS